MNTFTRYFLMMMLLLAAGSLMAQDLSKAEKKAQKAEQKAAKKAAKSKVVITPVLEAAPPVEAAPVVVAIDSVPLTTIAFQHDTYDFGKIKAGEVIKHEFVFTNTGPNPLIIENVKPSCGCTATEYSTEPVAPGKTGKIKAQFNSAGKVGQQLKYITIVFNGDPKITRVAFTGEILPDGVTPEPGN